MYVPEYVPEYATVYDAAMLRLPGLPLAAAGIVVALVGWLLGHAVSGGASGELHWMVDTPEGAHWYRYDRSPLAAGYTRRAPGSGGITNGVRVRIADVGGRIARLEAGTGAPAGTR